MNPVPDSPAAPGPAAPGATAVTASAVDPVVMMAALVAWSRAEYGSDARVESVARMPGHGGISYGFDVLCGAVRDRLVIRVPPAGVTRRNSTDVLRLVPLLEELHAAGIRVPSVRFHGTDERWFGVPYLIVERVRGATLPDVFTRPQSPPDTDAVVAAFRRALTELVAIHQLPLTPRLRAWARPLTQQDDIDMWAAMLQRGHNEEWTTEGLAVREALLNTAPPSPTSGVVHGDYYSNNWMFDGAELTAVLDWENSTLGPAMWDIGWITTIYDPACWGPSRHALMTWTPSPEDLLNWYEHVGGKLRDPDWYRALMSYRLGCISPYYLRLHRTGRRIDPTWELFGEAVPALFERARALLRPRCA